MSYCWLLDEKSVVSIVCQNILRAISFTLWLVDHQWDSIMNALNGHQKLSQTLINQCQCRESPGLKRPHTLVLMTTLIEKKMIPRVHIITKRKLFPITCRGWNSHFSALSFLMGTLFISLLKIYKNGENILALPPSELFFLH